MPHWLNLMIESFPALLWACIQFTIPLTLLSFIFGLALGFGVALVRLYQAPPPPDGRLSRLARASYLAIGAVAVMAIATVVAGFTELGSSVVVVLQPVGLLLVAPATWTYFRVRSGRADESHDAS